MTLEGYYLIISILLLLIIFLLINNTIVIKYQLRKSIDIEEAIYRLIEITKDNSKNLNKIDKY